MTKAESEKVVAVLCQADSGCALCVAKQIALFCVIFEKDIEWACHTACEAEPLGMDEEDLIDMVEVERDALVASTPANTYLPV